MRRKLVQSFPRTFALSFLVALSLLNLHNVYIKDIWDIERVIIIIIIIIIIKYIKNKYDKKVDGSFYKCYL